LCACPKESLDFQRDVWRFFSYLVSWGEKWLFVLMTLFTITCLNIFS
jgi:hypothetical protein